MMFLGDYLALESFVCCTVGWGEESSSGGEKEVCVCWCGLTEVGRLSAFVFCFALRWRQEGGYLLLCFALRCDDVEDRREAICFTAFFLLSTHWRRLSAFFFVFACVAFLKIGGRLSAFAHIIIIIIERWGGYSRFCVCIYTIYIYFLYGRLLCTRFFALIVFFCFFLAYLPEHSWNGLGR
ncbi:hypothetical protein QBC41DRAFT_309904 [Cercophora samala]|uniref:Uncharacterized protein n=1 Tax=Cercophora samala TaxID=330535 RepID=A0AA39ZNG0_9PEZI|nr:hypothetical protein QBC41DRAFT_309904 [Cercophora samala]